MIDWTSLGIRPARFLLPKPEHLNRFWPIIACDQYTSQPEIWEEADHQVGDRPSTLRLIIPEAFLDRTEELKQKALLAMEDYLARDLFTELPPGIILVERQTQSGTRLGLVVTVDLEEYEYLAGSRSLIRATEQTVMSRIPPRIKLRMQSAIELSHVLLVVDDREDTLLNRLAAMTGDFQLLYDLELLMQGGRIRGWHIGPGPAQEMLAATLTALKAALPEQTPLYAVGDGNHSLAAAKANWMRVKGSLSPEEWETHPARFATVELTNLHSPAMVFEPIHRVVFGSSLQAIQEALAGLGPVLDQEAPDITLVAAGRKIPLALPGAQGRLVIDAVQEALDHAKFSLDYVHGDEALHEIVEKEGAVGILMPDFPKDALFPTVVKDGRLPRKTFSMGEANEKRFYLEARKIIK